MSGFGQDFSVYWKIGQAILNGQDPYSVELSLYPPITTFFFALFALLPLIPSFAVWMGLNILMFLDALRRTFGTWQSLVWLLFMPTLFVLLSGQNDIVFLWLGSLMVLGGWKAAIAGAFLTLKPQMAIIILPWFLIRWLQSDRRQLVRCLGVMLVLHGIPLLIDPGLYPRWLNSISGETGWRMLASPGIFTLVNFQVPVLVIALLALAAALWALTRDALTSRTAQLFALPMGLWYDNVLLLGAMPAWIFIPLSWAVFVAAALVENSIPLALLPIAALAWRMAQAFSKHKQQKEGAV